MPSVKTGIGIQFVGLNQQKLSDLRQSYQHPRSVNLSVSLGKVFSKVVISNNTEDGSVRL